MTAPNRTAAGSLPVVDSIDAIGSDRWTALVRAAGGSVFYSYDFLASMEAAPLSAPSRARYLLSYDDRGALAAALPVYLQWTRDPFAEPPDDTRYRALLGHVWHCYDTRLLSAGPITVDLVRRFWGALEALATAEAAQVWGLVNVALSEPLAECLGADGITLAETAPRYRLPVAGGPDSLDQHLARVGRSSRRHLRQYWRRAERAGAAVSMAEGRAVLDEQVLALCRRTADKHAPGYYPPGPLAGLIERLGTACQIIRVELGGRLLAASICLFDHLRMHAWAGGCRYPPELNWSPQYVLFAAELRAGFATGLPVIECGRRNDAFKARYGLQPYRLGRVVRWTEATP